MTAEDTLQIQCVAWFRAQYSPFSMLLHHSPNGGKRNAIEAMKFKRMGTISGFADLFLMMPNKTFNGLFVELKVGKNKQTENQKAFEKEAVNQLYAYRVCYTFDEFVSIVKSYLKNQL